MSETLLSGGSASDRTASEQLPLEMFTLDQAVLEVRYEPSYLFWDRSGQLWHQIAKEGDSLRPLEAQPNRTSFAIEDKFQLFASVDNSRIHAYYPIRNLDDFGRRCDLFFAVVFSTLSITTLERVGLRLIYSREYPKIEDADNILVHLKLTQLPPPKQFGVKTSNPRPEYLVRCEDAALGFVLRIKSETQTTDVRSPLGTKDIKTEKIERHRILFDLDHYTTVPMRQGQLRPSEWIKDRVHATNRDSKSFLRG